MQQIEIRVERRIGFEALVWAFHARDGRGVAQPLQFVERDTAEYMALEPFMQLDFECAQRLVDELWEAGVRPSQMREMNEPERTALIQARDWAQLTADRLLTVLIAYSEVKAWRQDR